MNAVMRLIFVAGALSFTISSARDVVERRPLLALAELAIATVILEMVIRRGERL